MNCNLFLISETQSCHDVIGDVMVVRPSYKPSARQPAQSAVHTYTQIRPTNTYAPNTHTPMADLSETKTSERKRLDNFVQEMPGAPYNIDQYNSMVCRRLQNGNESCVRLKLEFVEMFDEMQKLGFFCALPTDPKKTHMECQRK
ncbi:hypothetical protein BC937DRAFT_94553 [Endogone sp. FLAS-F59071]|nr:hypothetical protein BC937DRAFT_94553 [Endogone sp. FLAS-F59071]|eukprot:RUS20702.1 hypothetical protein BC937DRAFT_94553 [Endogone sp. FLAS-F59071]